MKSDPEDVIGIPSDHVSIWAIGMITIEWNYIEHLLECLLELFLVGHGLSYEFVEPMGNATRTELLFKYILNNERNKRFKIFFMHAQKHLLICRENRNFLSHGRMNTHSKNHITIERVTRRQSSRTTSKIMVHQLMQVSEDMVHCIEYLNYISANTSFYKSLVSNGARRKPLPRKHALPHRIWENPSPTPKSRKRPRQSSRA